MHLSLGPEADLRLLPERAAWDAARRTLFVADLHLGKAAVFRQAGLGLPEGPDADTLQRLDALVRRTGAARLVLLGDLLHARAPGLEATLAALTGWHRTHPQLEWRVIPGNHDRRVPWADWLPWMQVGAEGEALGPWRLAHHPPAAAAAPTLCGHLHPGLALGRGRQRRLRVPCFWLRRQVLVLPAFGAFTGLQLIPREPGDAAWVPLGDRVAPVPATA